MLRFVSNTLRARAATASALALLSTGVPVLAQDTAAQQATEPAVTAQAEEKIVNAVSIFNVYVQAIGSDDVKTEIKNRLYQCLYFNKFEFIADEVEQLIAANEGLDRSNDTHVYIALGLTCGNTPEQLGLNVSNGAAQAAPAEGAGR